MYVLGAFINAASICYDFVLLLGLQVCYVVSSTYHGQSNDRELELIPVFLVKEILDRTSLCKVTPRRASSLVVP